MLLSCLQDTDDPTQKCRVLRTLGNAAAFTVNQVQIYFIYKPETDSFVPQNSEAFMRRCFFILIYSTVYLFRSRNFDIVVKCLHAFTCFEHISA